VFSLSSHATHLLSISRETPENHPLVKLVSFLLLGDVLVHMIEPTNENVLPLKLVDLLYECTFIRDVQHAEHEPSERLFKQIEST
jgi:hypothetical protein